MSAGDAAGLARLGRLAPAAALLGAVLLAHGATLANGFVWDDETIIVKNPDTRSLSRLGKVVLTPDDQPPYYRPLNRASYLLDHRLFGMTPWGFHLVNLLAHAGAVLALYALGRRLFGVPGPALAAALLLAVHPLCTEAVAFVSARNNLLALLFSALAVAWFIDADRQGSWRRAAASGLCFLLGLLSKEPAAMALPVMGIWLLIERRGPLGPRALRLLPHLAGLAVYLALRAVALGGLVGTPTGAVTASRAERIASNLFTIPAYLRLVLFPADLTIFHVVPTVEPGRLLAHAPAWLAIAAAAWWLLRQGSSPSLLGLAWFALGLLPMAGIFSLPTTTALAERFLYIPAAGLWLVAADQLARAWDRPRWRTSVLAASGLVVALLAGRSALRARDWRDDLTLARAAVEVEPRAPMARYNLGLALQEHGDREGARAQWLASAESDTFDGRALIGLGTLAAEDGDLAGAEAYYLRALPTLAGPVEAHLNLGKLHDRRGDALSARREWEAVLRARPDHADALAQLGVLDATAGDLTSAERRFRAALAADPQMAEGLFNLARLLEATRRPAEAVQLYERFLRSPQPRAPEAESFASRRVALLRRQLQP